MRKISAMLFVVAAMATSLFLAATASAYTPQQIDYTVGSFMVGGHITGGPNVQTLVHSRLPKHQAQLVVNDCSTNPNVGQWIFFRKIIKVLDCNHGTILDPRIPIPHDYQVLGMRAVQKACRMILATANYKQPRGTWQHMRFPCGSSLSLFNGVQENSGTINPGVPVNHVEVDYTCPRGRVHRALSRVILNSDGTLVKYWCDYSSLTYGHRVES
jgi:hypothetical protein